MTEPAQKFDSPCLAFLIPFAPRRVKSKWDTACVQLQQTLKSLQNSASGSFCVVVAGHDTPDFEVSLDDRFCFLSVDQPPPAHPNHGVAVRLDKLMKITAAWNYAKAKWNPRYVMKLDADDFVSSKLVGWLDREGSEAGYLIPHGWIWRAPSRHFIRRTETLDRICGSCLIIRSDLADQTGPFLTEVEGVVLDKASSEFAARDHYALVPGSGTSTLLANDSHQRYAAQFAHLGHKLASVPFAAVIYRTGNADSITGGTWHIHNLRMLAGSLRRMRLITAGLRREFCLTGE
jgi:hypothetical protein